MHMCLEGAWGAWGMRRSGMRQWYLRSQRGGGCNVSCLICAVGYFSLHEIATRPPIAQSADGTPAGCSGPRDQQGARRIAAIAMSVTAEAMPNATTTICARAANKCPSMCAYQTCNSENLDCSENACMERVFPNTSWPASGPQLLSQRDELAVCVTSYLATRPGGLFMVGDSVTDLLFDELAWHVAQQHGEAETSALWPARLSGRRGITVPRYDEANRPVVCKAWPSIGFRLCFLATSRNGGSKRVSAQRCPGGAGKQDVRNAGYHCSNASAAESSSAPYVKLTRRQCDRISHFSDYNLGDTLECAQVLSLLRLPGAHSHARQAAQAADDGRIRPHDHILTNVGVHHAAKPHETIPANIRAMGEWLSAVPAEQRPVLVWRETLPQHFARSLDGSFSTFKSCKAPQRANHSFIRSDARRQQNTSTWCVPMPSAGVAGGQRYNLAAEDALAEARIPIARTFKLTAPFWDEHPGCIGDFRLDCTHVHHMHSATHSKALCSSLSQLAATAAARRDERRSAASTSIAGWPRALMG